MSRREEKGKEQTKVVLCDEKKKYKCPALLTLAFLPPQISWETVITAF